MSKITSADKKVEKVTANKIFKFVGVGIACTIVDYSIYSLMVMLFFGGDTSQAWLATIVSGVVATFAAYELHSHITWKTSDPGKYGIIKFFAWNALLVAAIRPALTFILGLLEGFYQFVFMISDGIHLPFSYEFVESTSLFVLMTAITMILNFLFYNRIVFGKAKVDDAPSKASGRTSVTNTKKNQREKVDVDSVGKAGKEKQGNGKSQNNAGKKRK